MDKIINKGPTVFICLCAFVLMTGQSHADSNNAVNLGARIASTEEIVDYLAPPVSSEKPELSRGGLRLLETTAPEHRPRSVSLQVNFAYNSHELTGSAIEQLKPVGSALVSERLRSLCSTSKAIQMPRAAMPTTLPCRDAGQRL